MVMSKLIDNEYPFLQKELFLHLGDVSPSHPDYDPAAAAAYAEGACTRGEGCKCMCGTNECWDGETQACVFYDPAADPKTAPEDCHTEYDCDAAGNASAACMMGAMCYVVTLAMSAGCCVMGKEKKPSQGF